MGIHEIRVSPEFSDPHAHGIERQAAQHGVDDLDIQTGRVFYIEGVTDEEAITLAEGLLSDPVTESYTVQQREDWNNANRIEVSPLPGVTNPEMASITYGAKLLGISPTAVESGTEYLFDDGVSRSARGSVVSTLLVNKTVEQVRSQAPETLIIEGAGGMIETLPIRGMDEVQLIELSKRRKVALNVREMGSIKQKADAMRRDIRDAELEYLGAAWSEHCCHKTTNAPIETAVGTKDSIFQRIKDRSILYFEKRQVLSAFGDNSGVVRFYDGTAINIKLETHNSPRMVEPRGGAATGTGGVLRDINETGLGARPINSMHMDFTAAPDINPSLIPPNTLTPTQLLTGSVRGVGGYGNPMGIPTNNGSFHTHPDYRGKASILVGSMGIMQEKDAQKGSPLHGDLVVAVGGRTGLDGIHGATFSSESADSTTATVHSGAVQIGDPIAEKKMFDAVMEASEKGLIRAMTDCGAAGFASAIGELGEDIGVSVDLALAPLKYSGLQPWEIFLSESQERGVLAVAPEHAEEVQAIFAKHSSEATVLGIFGSNGEPTLDVRYGDQQVIELDYEFIKNGRINEPLYAEWTPPDVTERLPVVTEWEELLTATLSDWNVCSKEPIVRRYDHEVQGSSAMTPYAGVNGDAPNNSAVMTPILGKPYAIIQAHGCNPRLTELDPSRGSTWSYVEAMSNYVAVGGNPDDAVIVNNYISATPTDRVMGALDMSVDALTTCVAEFESPIISGKDSLSSTYKNPDGTLIESPYNLIVTVAGKIPDVEKTVSTDIKKPGSTLVLIGQQDLESFGGSVYYDNFDGDSAHVPNIDIQSFHRTSTALHKAIQSGKVLAAHDVSEGGVAVTISEMLFGGDCGAELDFGDSDTPIENIFFNETAGCFVIEVDDEETAAELFGSIPHQVIGKTKEARRLDVSQGDITMPSVDLDTLKSAWKRPLQEVFA